MAVMLLYGQPGSGKTIQATRLPGKTLLLSSDNSSHVLRNFNRPNLTIVEVEGFTEWVAAFEEATASKQYDNIVSDCLTDLVDSFVVKLREDGFNGDIRQYYLAVYNKVKYLVRKAAFCGTNCVFTCWEETDTVTMPNGEIVNRVTPMLPAKIKQQVCGLCNIVAYVTSANDKQGNRQWYYVTEGTPAVMAKDQLYMRKNCMPEDIFTAPENK